MAAAPVATAPPGSSDPEQPETAKAPAIPDSSALRANVPKLMVDSFLVVTRSLETMRRLEHVLVGRRAAPALGESAPSKDAVAIEQQEAMHRCLAQRSNPLIGIGEKRKR